MAIPRNLSILAQGASASGVLSVTYGGTGVTTSTGTGSVVLSNSPSLVTPTLGAASATSITASLGTVGAPSYTFTGDTNTGIYSPAADTLAFVEGGVEAMRIDSSGNVGISGNGGSSTNRLSFTYNGVTGEATIGPNSTGGSTFLTFGTSSSGTYAERFRVGSSGQFGVGGANYGTSGQVLTSQGSGAAPVWSTPSSGGVTSLTAGSGITVSASTGAVTVSQDIYTGSTANNTTYPIGTCILLGSNNGGFVAASSQTVRIVDNNASNAGFFIGTGTQPALTGTWRIRGQSGDFGAGSGAYVLQRTA